MLSASKPQAVLHLFAGRTTHLRTLTPTPYEQNQVYWAAMGAEGNLWAEGEKIKAWKARIASSTVQSQHSVTSSTKTAVVIHLGVVRGGSDVYPSLQRTIASMSMES